MPNRSAYTQLTDHYRRMYRFGHVAAIVSWDRNTKMPPAGNAARAAAEAELRGHIHGLRRDSRLGTLISHAEDEPLDELARANLREIRRDWREACALPESLVAARTLAGARCEHAWRRQRPANDWRGFLDNFEPVVDLVREEALRLAEASGLTPYDALIDRFEPGMTSAELDRVFDPLRRWLPGLIAGAREHARDRRVVAPAGPFPVAAQRRLSHAVMTLLGFDFEAGRLDESAHPFTGGVAEDVRLTTRYDEDDFRPALRSTLHETGHARYAQGLPRAWLDQPLGRPRSFAIHESQSLFVEMQLGRSRPFVGLLAPLLREHLGAHAGFEADALYRQFTHVAPGRIRVEADEPSYPAHILLRYDIERALISGDIEARDIPVIWDEKMAALLGIDTRGDYRDGCLQDVHWCDGSFGYFPSYTLGAMYAAQWFAALRRALPDVEARVAAGDLVPVFDWLAANVWSHASHFDTPELVRRASGEALNPAYYRAHLEARYLAAD